MYMNISINLTKIRDKGPEKSFSGTFDYLCLYWNNFSVTSKFFSPLSMQAK